MIDVRLEGQANLERLLQLDHVLGNGWRLGLIGIRDALARRVEERAPLKSGALRAGIETEIDSRPTPMWAGVSSLTRAKGGFDYGLYLDISSRPHYRSTRYAGSPTRGWFTNTLDAAQGEIISILGQMARRISAEWR